MKFVEQIKKLVGYKSFEDKLIEFGFSKTNKNIEEFLNLKTMKIIGAKNSDVFIKDEYLISSIKYYMNPETIFAKKDLVIFKNIPNQTPDWFVLSYGLGSGYVSSRNTDRVKSLNTVELQYKNPSVLASNNEKLPEWLNDYNYGYLSIEITKNGLCLSMPIYYDLEFVIEQIETIASKIISDVGNDY